METFVLLIIFSIMLARTLFYIGEDIRDLFLPRSLEYATGVVPLAFTASSRLHFRVSLAVSGYDVVGVFSDSRSLLPRMSVGHTR